MPSQFLLTRRITRKYQHNSVWKRTIYDSMRHPTSSRSGVVETTSSLYGLHHRYTAAHTMGPLPNPSPWKEGGRVVETRREIVVVGL